jgi:nicotinamidase-related amidase
MRSGIYTLPEAPAEIPGTAEVVPGMRRLVRAFRQSNRPVVHVARLYRPDGSNVDLCRRYDAERGKCVVFPGTIGAELVDGLKPSPEVRLDAESLLEGGLQQIRPSEWIMYKPRWGPSTELPWRNTCATSAPAPS